MVQLTLAGNEACCTLADAVSSLTGRWSDTLGEGDHLAIAARATCRRFAEWSARPLSERERARIASYFSAVVRKATMRKREPGAVLARRRLIAATIEADLLDAGWSAERAAAEVLRVMGRARPRALSGPPACPGRRS